MPLGYQLLCCAASDYYDARGSPDPPVGYRTIRNGTWYCSNNQIDYL